MSPKIIIVITSALMLFVTCQNSPNPSSSALETPTFKVTNASGPDGGMQYFISIEGTNDHGLVYHYVTLTFRILCDSVPIDAGAISVAPDSQLSGFPALSDSVTSLEGTVQVSSTDANTLYMSFTARLDTAVSTASAPVFIWNGYGSATFGSYFASCEMYNIKAAVDSSFTLSDGVIKLIFSYPQPTITAVDTPQVVDSMIRTFDAAAVPSDIFFYSPSALYKCADISRGAIGKVLSIAQAEIDKLPSAIDSPERAARCNASRWITNGFCSSLGDYLVHYGGKALKFLFTLGKSAAEDSAKELADLARTELDAWLKQKQNENNEEMKGFEGSNGERVIITCNRATGQGSISITGNYVRYASAGVCYTGAYLIRATYAVDCDCNIQGNMTWQPIQCSGDKPLTPCPDKTDCGKL